MLTPAATLSLLIQIVALTSTRLSRYSNVYFGCPFVVLMLNMNSEDDGFSCLEDRTVGFSKDSSVFLRTKEGCCISL